ncbi:MAG: DUF3160 domain-containing protein [Fimbriimonadales bacterium]
MKYVFALAVAAMSALASAQTGHYKPYSVSPDFREVANRQQFLKFVTLAPEHKALLAKNLFVVSPRGDDQLIWVYGQNDYRNLPSLVTTDTVLHLYHVFFDATLRKTEQDSLLPKLRRMSERLVISSQHQIRSAPDAATREAATKNLAYFTVATDLLLDADRSSNRLASAEFKRIKAAKGFEVSAIFPYKVDYSRFFVRGHYTKSESLKRYFRAMTWYGMMPFALADPNGNPMPEQIRMAVLASDALRTSGETTDWSAIYDVTSLYVGASNMYTPQEIHDAAIKIFGSTTRLSPSQFQAFVNAVRAIRVPGIQARITLRKGVPNSAVQFRFMGLRYIPDSEVLQRVTGEDRPMPAGLDVMAAFGSGRAAQILDSSPARYNSGNWTGYIPERSKVTADIAKVPAATWSSNLYWSWLDTLRLYLQPVPSGYPQFMLKPAWQDKNLSTALASWTELRHDTILYGEQSVAEGGEDESKTPPPPFVKGFVEPRVAVYDRLINLLRQSRTDLQKLRMLDKTGVDKFHVFEELLSFFAAASTKELAGAPLTKKEHLRIRNIESEFNDLTDVMLKYGNNFRALTSDDFNMALIADVHTGAASALEEAVGKADDLIAVVPIEGKLYFARGAVFSYYEFTVPISERMTDEAWKSSLENDKDHPRPHWVGSYFTTVKAKEKE